MRICEHCGEQVKTWGLDPLTMQAELTTEIVDALIESSNGGGVNLQVDGLRLVDEQMVPVAMVLVDREFVNRYETTEMDDGEGGDGGDGERVGQGWFCQ